MRPAVNRPVGILSSVSMVHGPGGVNGPGARPGAGPGARPGSGTGIETSRGVYVRPCVRNGLVCILGARFAESARNELVCKKPLNVPSILQNRLTLILLCKRSTILHTRRRVCKIATHTRLPICKATILQNRLLILQTSTLVSSDFAQRAHFA